MPKPTTTKKRSTAKKSGTTKSVAPSAVVIRQRKHRIKEIFAIFGVLIVFVFIAPAVLSLFFHDIQPVSAPDLQPSKVTVAAADNAYYDLAKLESSMPNVEELWAQTDLFNAVLSGKPWDQSVVDTALAKNAESLRYFTDAAHKPAFQYPPMADPANINVTDFQAYWGYVGTSRLAAINALNLQKQGKEQEAFQQAMDIVRLGDHIQNSLSPLVGYFVGTGMKIAGMQTMQQLLAATTLKGPALTQYSAQLQAVTTKKESLANAFKMEHLFLTGFLQEDALMNNAEIRDNFHQMQTAIIWRYWVPRSYYFQPNKIIAEWITIDRARVVENVTPCTLAVPTFPQPTHRYWWISMYFLPNAMGRFLGPLGFYGYVDVSARQHACNEDSLNAATQTLLALKAYAADNNGVLPETLSKLVPAYLPLVPIDPYDGAAMKYSATKKIVYSIGNDHVDNGGSTGDDWRLMADPTFVIQ